jgi:hypothetical protein
MKKLAVGLVVFLMLMMCGAFIFYRYYLPDMVADALTGEEMPTYVPNYVKVKIGKFKEPLNKGTEDVIREIHQSDISLEQVIKAIDQTERSQIDGALEELKRTNAITVDGAFDIFKKYFPADFDVEALRQPFHKNVTISIIKKAKRYADSFDPDEPMDAEIAKAVVKKMLYDKEKEFNLLNNK